MNFELFNIFSNIYTHPAARIRTEKLISGMRNQQIDSLYHSCQSCLPFHHGGVFLILIQFMRFCQDPKIPFGLEPIYVRYCEEQHFYQFELCFVFLNSEKVKKEVLSFFTFWHRVIFPQDFPYSIVTAVEFHHQIRNGLVWFLYA